MMSEARTACVTGATSGIGLAFARALAMRGYDLILAGRSADRLAHIADTIERDAAVRVQWVAGDLAEIGDQDALGAIIAATPSLTLLVNNAGVGSIGTLADGDLGDLRAMIAINVGAVAALSLAALPTIRRRHGHIINVASGVAFAAMAGAATYGGTKAFVTQFSRALALEVDADGATVQTLVPGLTRTNLGGAESSGFFDRFPPEWIMQPDDLVAASLIAMDRRETLCAPGVQDPECVLDALGAMELLGNAVSHHRPAARYLGRQTE